jgi:hypothetical protein
MVGTEHDTPERNDTSSCDDATLGHRNLIAYSRALACWGSLGGFDEGEGVLAYAGGSWIPVIGNGAFRTDDTVSPAALVDRADGFFAERQRGYSVKVRDTGQDDDLQKECEARGLVFYGEPVPEMICHRTLPVLDLPQGVRLDKVTDAEGLIAFNTVNTDAYATYGMPGDVLPDIFDQPDVVLADKDTHFVVAYLNDRPVAAALTYLSDGIASLQWVGTVSDVRHLSLGRAVTVWATNVAFEQGAAACTLQASPMGQPLYADLGYKTIYHYRDLVRWTAPTI